MNLQTSIFPPVERVTKEATISPCGKYRYRLTRTWDYSAHPLPIIMLNPSTADAEVDDPTIRRCMAFARRERFGGICVMNLFAFRATHPSNMKAATDPVGPDCSTQLAALLTGAALFDVPVLAAWGAHGNFRDRDGEVKALAQHHGARLACLGRTAAGHPRHPLYVRGDQPLEEFS